MRAPSTRTVPRAACPGRAPGQEVQERGLARARRPEDREHAGPGRARQTPERLCASSGASTEGGRLGPGPAWPETPRRIFFTTPPGLAAVTAVAYTRTFSQLTTGRARAEDEGAPESPPGRPPKTATRSPRTRSRVGLLILGSPGSPVAAARAAASTALGPWRACSAPAARRRAARATRSNAAAAGTEYSERLSEPYVPRRRAWRDGDGRHDYSRDEIPGPKLGGRERGGTRALQKIILPRPARTSRVVVHAVPDVARHREGRMPRLVPVAGARRRRRTRRRRCGSRAPERRPGHAA